MARPAFGVLSLLTLLLACGPATPGSSDAPNGAPPSEPSSNSDESNLIYASGWSEISMIANFAKTEIDPAAHFHTGRNACGKEEFGALELTVWNRLAKNANVVAHLQPLAEEYCLPGREGPRVMDGTVEMKIGRNKQSLFEARGNEICTKIADKAAAAALLDAIHEVVAIADREGCPNGWGSGLR